MAVSDAPSPKPEPPATGRRRIDPKKAAIWAVVSLVAASGWGALALARGERISATWLVAAAVGSYAIGYRFYARFIVEACAGGWMNRGRRRRNVSITASTSFPTDRRVLFGHHFAAIAGAGPLVGPVLAAQMGYLPGTIWIIVGAIFAGAVQDMVTLFFSMRRDGKSARPDGPGRNRC